MGSPRSQRSRPSVDHVVESNSTASLFLGSSRRAWMPGPACPQTREALPATTSLPDARPTSVQESALISLVTPGTNLQHSVSLVKKSSAPAALPSPVPSTNSHPSPVIAHNPAPASAPCRRPAAVPRTSYNGKNAVQSSQHATVPQQNSTMTTATPRGQHSAGPGPTPSSPADGLPPQSPTDQSLAQSSSSILTGPGVICESAGGASRPTQQGPAARQPSGLILPEDETWAQWKSMLEGLRKEAQQSPAPKLAGPRIRLLEDACEYKDLLYLVLHQLYCRQSVDDNGLQEFPNFRDQTCQAGLARVQELIEPNIHMGAPMIWKLAHFPQPLEVLKHQAWYGVAVGKAVHCLTRLAKRVAVNKAHIFDSVYHRGYPPMAAELLGLLDATSPVLMTVIFVSTCRCFYEDKSMAKVNQLFRHDLHAHFHGQRSNLSEEYKKIPIMPRLLPSRASVPSSSAFQAVPSPVARVPSTDSQVGIASPVISGHPNPHSGQVSPRGLPNPNVTDSQTVAGWQVLQSPVYQHSPYLPPEQPTRQGQTRPGQSPQMQRFWHQGQWVQYNPTRMQHLTPEQPQSGYYGHVQRAQQGAVQAQAQTQQALQAQMQHTQIQTQRAQGPMYQSSQVQTQHPTQTVAVSNSSPITTDSRHQSNTTSSWDGQVSPHSHQCSAGPSSITAQSDPRQSPSMQSVRTHLTGQGQLPNHPRHMSTPLTNAPQRIRSQGPSAQQLPQSGQQLPHNSRVQPAPFRPLLRPPDYQLPQTVSPNPTYMALHQADLRELEKKLVEFGPNKDMTEAQLFQYLGDLVLQPKVIDSKELRFDLKFTLTEEVCGRFPRLEHRGMGKRPKQIIQPGCFIFRLRCITLRPFEQENPERLWSTKNTIWPSVLYIFVNEKEMFLRRKAHNGKDLPLEISENLRPGLNTVTIHLLLKPDECRTFNYGFGIESMHISKFESVRGLVSNTRADETLLNIRKRLTLEEDSDDLAVVTDSLRISLIDPFMAQIFKTPVRARDCEHLECFDLDTFIITRKNVSGFAALNDNWRCPICSADARPQLLRVDGFFLAVRDRLIAMDNLEGANAIEVKADGSWTLQAIRNESPNTPRSPRVDKSRASALGKRKGENIQHGSDATRPKYENLLDRRNFSNPTEPVVIEID